MKKIFLFWALFAVLFFGIVTTSYFAHLNNEIVIVALLVLYVLFQGFALRQAYKHGRDWIVAGIVLQAILAMCSPLYYSNF